MNRVLTCEEASRRFFSYLDRALSGAAADEMEAHLEACLDCCDKLAFSRQLDAFVKTRLPDAPPPVDLERRIRDRLTREGGASSGDAPGALPPTADRVLDGGDQACGELLLAVKSTLDAMQAGEVLKLICHDPGARVDLPVWCGMTRHSLLWSNEDIYYIRRRAS
jgi:anti-sigma factor (TIGR02949 family)